MPFCAPLLMFVAAFLLACHDIRLYEQMGNVMLPLTG